MSLNTERNEIEDILFRTLDNLSLTVSSQTSPNGSNLRRQIGRVRGDYFALLCNGGFAIALLTCFRLAHDANVQPARLAYVRQQLYEEEPSGPIATNIVMTAITFCLATESRMVANMTFVSRDDCEAMMKKMKIAFDAARDLAADAIDSNTYQTLTFLAGGLTNHLATSARPLPRMVNFNMALSLPSLAASHRIYYVADRAEELAAENHVIHPAFMPMALRGLNR